LNPASGPDTDTKPITFRRTDGQLETIETSSVFRTIGYRGLEAEGLPFDPLTATIPHNAGHVVEPQYDDEIPGAYCSG